MLSSLTSLETLALADTDLIPDHYFRYLPSSLRGLALSSFPTDCAVYLSSLPKLQSLHIAKDQTITWEDETTFTLEATVTWSAALMRWLLGWSADIEVLGPADLVKAYKMELKRLIERAK